MGAGDGLFSIHSRAGLIANHLYNSNNTQGCHVVEEEKNNIPKSVGV